MMNSDSVGNPIDYRNCVLGTVFGTHTRALLRNFIHTANNTGLRRSCIECTQRNVNENRNRMAAGTMERRCPGCGDIHPIAMFPHAPDDHDSRDRGDGLLRRSHCSNCRGQQHATP